MKITRILSLLAVVAVLAVTACKKDNPTPTDPNNPGGGGNNNPPAPTRTSKLVEKQWKVKETRMIESGRTDTTTINIVGAANWRFTFRADRTGTATGTFLATSADPNPNYNWSFNVDSTNVTLVAGNGRSASYAFRNDTLLVRSVENLTLQLINSQGQPVGTVTGTLLETFNRVN
ncbi:MAG: hypothetical protein C0424_02215 [Sphingobacteriaceae bacterium]|nr:hypothetical protein [Sphingobacteriaceae bacterium]